MSEKKVWYEIEVVFYIKNNINLKFKDGPFIWNKGIQGFMLASYFYGYIFTQVPG